MLRNNFWSLPLIYALILCGCGGAPSGPSNLNPSQPQKEFLYAAGADDLAIYSIDLGSGKLTSVKAPTMSAGTTTLSNSFASASGSQLLYDLTPLNDAVNAYTVAADGTLTPAAGSPFAPPGNGGFVNLGPIAVTPNASMLFALNPIDQIAVFQANVSSGVLTPKSMPIISNGIVSGLAVDPSGQNLYISVESVSAGQQIFDAIYAYSIDSSAGTITQLPDSPYHLPDNSQVRQVLFDPAGKFLYAVLFNTGKIAGFLRNSTTGALTPMTASPFQLSTQVFPEPESAAMHPTGKYLYVYDLSDGVVGFNIDPTSGALTPIAGSPFAPQSNPNNPKILITQGPIAAEPSGSFLYALCDSAYIAAYKIDQTTGALSIASGSPYPSPENVYAVYAMQAP